MKMINSGKYLVALMVAITLALPVQAQVTIKQKEQHSVFEGVFLSIWARLKSIQPSQRQMAKTNTVYTAGIRGAESTETLLKPYWKNDLSQDEVFQKQLKQFGLAQDLMDKGELKQAVTAFDQFIEQFADSDLLPNAQFSKGLCQAALGDAASAKTSIQAFIDNNPAHDLVEDARQVIAQLN